MNFKIVIFILKSLRNRNPNRKMGSLYGRASHFAIWIAICPSISTYISQFLLKIEIGWFQIAIFPFYNSVRDYTVIANTINIYLKRLPLRMWWGTFCNEKVLSITTNQSAVPIVRCGSEFSVVGTWVLHVWNCTTWSCISGCWFDMNIVYMRLNLYRELAAAARARKLRRLGALKVQKIDNFHIIST